MGVRLCLWRESRKEGKGKMEKDRENEDEKRRRSGRRRDWQVQKLSV